MRFRPCIDLHQGKVKQIVGSSLTDDQQQASLKTNFETDKSAAEFAEIYKKHHLWGGHVIMLGPGNEEQALMALKAYPNGLQVGGGITAENAAQYIDAGASHVIVTSYVFRDGKIDFERLEKLLQAIPKEKLVLDLSCRSRDGTYFVVTDRWQKFTDFEVNEENIRRLAEYCNEFLVHGVDVEGMRCGIMEDLVEKLGKWSPIPVTYAGGARSIADMDLVEQLGGGRVDLTIGSALDIFGGSEVTFEDVLDWHKKRNTDS
eukprot:TRINITY_DN8632_c0_g1_i1.p1 TRINITY_DN8632_c0_g1~~TRINITY_DN8632_c0_g1_i1.p1  ORF type:complete len:260 (+),score=76.06 TRINITY_DN8632_c0_g1_i1:77-856(+)